MKSPFQPKPNITTILEIWLQWQWLVQSITSQNGLIENNKMKSPFQPKPNITTIHEIWLQWQRMVQSITSRKGLIEKGRASRTMHKSIGASAHWALRPNLGPW